MVPLLLFVFLLEKIPAPGASDIAARTERLPMPKERRQELVRSFLPGIVALVVIYIMVTILREVRDSFMADMWRESGVELKNSSFVQTETIISIVILILIAVMSFVKNNFRAFILSQSIMLVGFIISGISTLFYLNNGLDVALFLSCRL